ncbi:hypothetical protein TNCT1_39800 [Streptomyces sp. 1-11]|nr:hypothetical protein TNCT1_39800 [Streptomyces sp. 1-11]
MAFAVDRGYELRTGGARAARRRTTVVGDRRLPGAKGRRLRPKGPGVLTGRAAVMVKERMAPDMRDGAERWTGRTVSPGRGKLPESPGGGWSRYCSPSQPPP